MDLDEWRSRINNLDNQILNLLNQRAEAALKIGDLKRLRDAPVYSPQREAEVVGDVRSGDLPRWRRGVTLDDGPAAPLAVELLGRADGDATRLRLTFTEGRKHEVKRFCDALGHRVVRLRRVAFGPIELGRLRPGQWRPLAPREVAQLRARVV